MTSNVEKELTSGLVEGWSSREYALALCFFVGGVLTAWHERGLLQLWQGITTLPPTGAVAIAVAGLVLLAASHAVVREIAPVCITLLEGYWPTRIGDYLREQLVVLLNKRLDKKRRLWKELSKEIQEAGKPSKSIPQSLRMRHSRLERSLAFYPADPVDRMPTTVGNALRSAERYPNYRYGLDGVLLWPRLWLLLSKEVRHEVSQARSTLERRAQLVIWGVLFLIWTKWSWIAVPVSVLAMYVGYRRVIAASIYYGDLIRACYDTHRFKLYESLRMPPPSMAFDELEKGKTLTNFILRGSAATGENFPFAGQSSTAHQSSTASLKMAE